MARALHADACRAHALVAWVVLWDLPAYPERYAARLVTIAALTANLSAKLDRAPTDQEVARMLAMSVAKLRRLRS
jgi:Sigma-70 region 3